MRDSLQIFSFLFSEWAIRESGCACGSMTGEEHIPGNCQNRQSNPCLWLHLISLCFWNTLAPEIQTPDFTKNNCHLFICYLHSSPYKWLEVARNYGRIRFRLGLPTWSILVESVSWAWDHLSVIENRGPFPVFEAPSWHFSEVSRWESWASSQKAHVPVVVLPPSFLWGLEQVTCSLRASFCTSVKWEQ